MKLGQTPWMAAFLIASIASLLLGCETMPSRSGAATTDFAPGRSASASSQRLALIIGNGKYKDSPLINPPNDARAMADVLREIGFTVTKLEDASLKEMNAAIRVFGDKLRKGGGVGLFYYAGHGMQIRGRNFLIPVDAEIQREDEVPYASFDVNIVLDKMESAGNGTNILILDACRNNPFARSFRSSATGLAQMDAPVGTYISFATAPGRVASDGSGANGLYTYHLITSIRQAGLKIEDVFKKARVAVMQDSSGQQVPWDNSSLTGDFYFVPRPSSTFVAATGSSASAPTASAPAAAAPAANKSPPAAPATTATTAAPAVTQPPRQEPVKTAAASPPKPPETSGREAGARTTPPSAGAQPPRSDPVKTAPIKAPPAQVAMVAPPGPPPAPKPGAAADESYRKAQEAQKKGQTAAAAELFEQAADQGHPAAQYELGLLYKIGRRPLPQDLNKARTLFGKAANGNNAAGAFEYGLMLDRGQGGEKNCKDAQRWLQKGAEQGIVEAMAALGDSLLRTCNGEKNPTAAARWFRAAADKASVPAQFSLGILYFNGDGVPKNPAEAKKWLELAASKGHPSAKFYLDRLN